MNSVTGIDFGTTNSVVAQLQPDGSVRTARFPIGAIEADVFRTVLCFWGEDTVGRNHLNHAAGPAAIEAYLEDPLGSRLIMSMKTYLAQRSFTQTRLFGRPHTLEQLVAMFLRQLLKHEPSDRAVTVLGRPVRFAGETADDVFGESRLRGACREAGLGEVEVAFEPEAAGYRFTRGLNSAATVLIADFGGGTSDFSLLRFEPGAVSRVTPLATDGVGIAGDSFDYRIIDHVVSPLLGKGSTYNVMGKDMPIPAEYFSAFARWHRLSMMRTPRTLREIADVARTSAHPEQLATLIRIVEEELGFHLYRVVSAAKAELSHAERTTLSFHHEGVAIEQTITRADFERWIAPDLAKLSATTDRVLAQAGLDEGDIDRVFLTGGTAFVPAVRGLFERRFGCARVACGGEFVSVAEGLALIGADRVSRLTSKPA